MSVADDKLNAPRLSHRAAPPGRPALRDPWKTLRTRRPALAALFRHGSEVAAWIAFYVIVRALLG